MKGRIAELFALLAATLVLLLAAPAMADPNAEELAAAKAAQERGAEIYAYDQAAWHSTDALRQDLDERGLSQDAFVKAGFAGFIVEPAADGLLLATYYGKQRDQYFAMARYWMRGQKVVRGGLLKVGEDLALSPLALTLIATRERLVEAAIADEVRVCGRTRFNSVILPPRADGTIPAYLMSSQEVAGTFPSGGHHLYVFDANGKVVSHRAFTKSCVLVNWKDLPEDAAGYGVSHLLDPQPTEIHVFISLMMPMPLFVITDQNKYLWQVDEGKISFKQVMKD